MKGSPLHHAPHKKGKAVAILAAAGAVALALAGCTSSSAPAAANRSVESIVTAWPADLTTLDPAGAASPQDFELAKNLYQGLVQVKFNETDNGSLLWDGLELAPALAESWEMEGTTATFHLRDDATFYPSGNPVTAEDVRFSYERIFGTGSAGDLNNGGLQSPEQIVVLDEKTVQFNFTDRAGNPIPATPTLLATMRMPTTGIVDSVEAKEHATGDDPFAGEWLRNNTAGTGPYYVDSRTPGQQLVLKAVPGAVPEPGFDTVTIRVVNNGSISSLMRGGEINVGVYGLTQKDFNDLESAGFTVDFQPTPEFTYLQMATEAGPLADEKVRQAIGYALPYDTIIDSVFFGRAERAESYVNLAAPGWTDAFAKYRTDVEQAEELMEEAGNPDVTVPLHYSNADPELEDMAIIIQDSLKEIGVNVEIRPEVPAAMSELIKNRAQVTPPTGDPDMLLVKWSAWIDDPKTPVGYATTTGGVNNYSLWSTPEVDAINQQYAFAPFSEERDAAYAKAQEIVADAAPLLPIAITGRTTVMAPGIEGASYSPEFGMRYWTLKPSDDE